MKRIATRAIWQHEEEKLLHELVNKGWTLEEIVEQQIFDRTKSSLYNKLWMMGKVGNRIKSKHYSVASASGKQFPGQKLKFKKPKGQGWWSRLVHGDRELQSQVFQLRQEFQKLLSDLGESNDR